MSEVELIRNLPFVDYCEIDRVNISSLCWLLKSAKNYPHQKAVPLDKDATRLGHAGHTSTLEPKLYAKSVAVWEGKRNTNAWKAFRAEQEEAGKLVLTTDQDEAARGIAEAVGKHPIASGLLDGGDKEITCLWTHERTGLEMKARLDHLDIYMRVLVDLKTTGAGIDPRKFARTAFDFHYDIKMAFYRDVSEMICGDEVAVGIVAAEMKPPHDVQVYDLGRPLLDAAAIGYEHLIDRLIYCRGNNYWPGVGEHAVQPLTFTPYQTRDYSALMARELDNE